MMVVPQRHEPADRGVLVEPGLAQQRDHVEPDGGRARALDRVLEDDLDEGGVAQHAAPGLEHELLEARPPGPPVLGDGRNFGQRKIGDRVEQFLLVVQVSVQRHRATAQRFGNAGHRDAGETVAVGNLERCGNHRLPVECPAWQPVRLVHFGL